MPGPEALLAHREWIERVARALVRGDADAQDVAQEAWADLLARPDRREPLHVRAWLRSVLRFKAIDAGRAARTRRLHEETAARPEAMLDDPADVVVRAETLEKLAHAVLGLDEPYRTTVLLRWFEDLTPRAIAERQRIPLETVRTRIKRGLAELRGRLDAEYGRDGRTWAIALLPFATKGGVLVKATTKTAVALAAVLLVAASVGFVWWTGEGRAPAGSSVDASLATASTTGTNARATAHSAVAESLPTAAAGAGELIGEVWFASPERPAPGVEIVIGSDPQTSRIVTTDIDGTFAAASLPEGFRGLVRARAAGFATVARALMPLRAGERRNVGLLTLTAAASVRFVVLDFDGNPVAGAAIEGRRTEIGGWYDPTIAAAAWRDAHDAERAVVTDASGRAAFEDIEPSEWTFVARKSGFADASMRDVTLRAGGPTQTLELHMFPGLPLTGRVVDRSGRGVADVLVWAETRFAAGRYSEALTPHVITDANGHYAFDDLVEGVHTVRISRPGSPLVGVGTVRLPASTPFDIVLAGRRLVGTVRDAETGSPLTGAVVRAQIDGVIEATTGVDGAYVLDTVVDTWSVYEMRVVKPGWYQAGDGAQKTRNPHFSDPPTILGSSQPVVRDFAMRRGAKVSGRVLCEGAPVRGARVMYQRQGAFGTVETTADAAGRYEFAGVPPSTIYLMPWSDGHLPIWPTEKRDLGVPVGDRVDVTTGEVAHDLAMKRLEAAQDNSAPASVRVKGRVFAAGSALRAGFVQIAKKHELANAADATQVWMAIARLPIAQDGSFDIEVSAPFDELSVRGGADGFVTRVVRAALVPDSPGVLQAIVELAPSGRISARAIAEATNEPVAGARVILDADERHGWTFPAGKPSVEVVAATTGVDGRFAIEGVSAGPHRVEVVADGLLPGRISLDASSQGETEIRLAPMHCISGTVAYEDGRPLALLSIDATFDEPSTSGWKSLGVATTQSDGSFVVGYLAAGTYKLLVTDGMSQAGIQRVELHGVLADTKDLRVTIRTALALRGRVVDPDGSPVANVNVQAWPESGHAFGNGTTREDGTFEMTGLEPQSYKVMAHAPGGASTASTA